MFRYDIVAGQVREWIATGVLKPGDRLLSVREMSAKQGFSSVTVHQAYGLLQDEGIIESRPRSGFFVAEQARQLPEFADPLEDLSVDEAVASERGGPAQLFRHSGGAGLASLYLSEDLQPLDDLYRLMANHLRWEHARSERLDWRGSEELREAIAKRSTATSATARARDIIVTRSVADSIGLCLDLLAPRGSNILVETPTDAATVAAVLDRGLNCVEIYSHPRYGVDPDQFQYLIENNTIAACVLSPCNHAPTGVSYSMDAARRIAEAATRGGVPIIENIAGQDLHYGAAPHNLSQFDTRNLVVRVGGLEDALGPRFGAGWVSYVRRDHHKFLVQRSLTAGEWARQRAIAAFISSRSYDRHLRRLRESVSSRTRKGLSLIFQHFPESCTVSRPTGGFMCWVRGPKAFNAIEAARRAEERGVAFSPGPLFSVSHAFGNFIALNLSVAWTPETERQIQEIGRRLLQT